ncbi:MAG: TolC family protein, partial [Psychroflexus maritimus]
FSIPIFLRKERGELKLAKIRKQDAEMELDFQTLQLKNKLEAAQQEIISFGQQRNQIEEISNNFSSLLSAEERKFQLGESSVFLINAREQKLIDAQLKLIKATARLLKSKARIFNLLANDLVEDNND